MSATPKSQAKSAVAHKDPRGRRRPVGWHRAAPLELKYFAAHADLLKEPKPRSGRSGGYVYWCYKGRLYWKRYVIPRDPRTPTQRRSRAAFGAASHAWSENQPLSEAQRAAWRAAAAKITTKPRLWQCGWRTPQIHFVAINACKDRWGLPLVLEPPARRRKKAECRMQNAKSSAPGPLATAPRVSPQVPSPKRLTRPSSDWIRPATVLLPGQYLWQSASARRVARILESQKALSTGQLCGGQKDGGKNMIFLASFCLHVFALQVSEVHPASIPSPDRHPP